MPPPAPTAASWRWSPTSSSLAPAASTCAWIAARRWCRPSRTRRPRPGRRRAAATSRRRRPAAPCGEAVLGGEPARRRCGRSRPSSARTSVAIWLVASPNTRPRRAPRSSGSDQALARAPTTKDLPVPAGPTRVSTRAPEVRTPRTAAAWSTPSSSPDSRELARGTGPRPRPASRRRRRGGRRRSARVRCGRARGWRRASRRARRRPSARCARRSSSGRASSPGRAASSGVGEREALVGEPVEQAGDVGAVGQAEGVGQGVVDRAGEVGAGPGGLAGLHVGQRGLEHLRR